MCGGNSSNHDVKLSHCWYWICSKTLQVDYVLVTSKKPNVCFSIALPKYRAAAVCTLRMLWSILERTGLHTCPGITLGLEAGFILDAYHFYTLLGLERLSQFTLNCALPILNTCFRISQLHLFHSYQLKSTLQRGLLLLILGLIDTSLCSAVLQHITFTV